MFLVTDLKMVVPKRWPSCLRSVKEKKELVTYKVTYLQLSNLFLSTEEHWLDSIHQHKAGTSPRILWLSALQWRIRCRRTVWPQKRLKNKNVEWLMPNTYQEMIGNNVPRSQPSDFCSIQPLISLHPLGLTMATIINATNTIKTKIYLVPYVVLKNCEFDRSQG